MSATITLTVCEGKLKGKEFTFQKPGKRLLGRADGCDVRLPGDWEYMTISRLHCLLEVNPPHIRVWDVGSRNGTYVNGERIGPGNWPPPPDLKEADLQGSPLHEGDVLQVGNIEFQVHISDLGADSHCPERRAEARHTVTV
jgi:pSer/pThr/pTyr-binding forkhead associated (FHA) protein